MDHWTHHLSFFTRTECTGILAFLSLEHSVVLFLNSNNIQNQVAFFFLVNIQNQVASALQTVSHKIKGGNILLLVATGPQPTRQESANNYTSINNYKILSHSEIRIVYIFLTLPIVYKLQEIKREKGRRNVIDNGNKKRYKLSVKIRIVKRLGL